MIQRFREKQFWKDFGSNRVVYAYDIGMIWNETEVQREIISERFRVIQKEVTKVFFKLVFSNITKYLLIELELDCDFVLVEKVRVSVSEM